MRRRHFKNAQIYFYAEKVGMRRGNGEVSQTICSPALSALSVPADQIGTRYLGVEITTFVSLAIIFSAS
jgi:hypothetical protein